MSKATVELIVGIAFTLGVLLLGYYTIALGSLKLGGTKRYLVDFEQVYGLKAGDPVRVEGFEKGEVESLRLLPNGKIRAVLLVKDDVDIFRDGSDVRVTPFSPLGGRVIEVKRGRDTRGAYTFFEHPQGVPLEQADVIEGAAEGELLQTLNRLVEENRKSIRTVVTNLEHVSEQLTRKNNVLGWLLNEEEGAKRLESVSTSLSSSAGRLDRILKRVEDGEGVVGGLLKDGHPLQRNLEGAVSGANDALASLSNIVKRADEGKSAIGVLVSDDPEATAATKGIVTDIRKVTDKVASGQGTLGKVVNDDRLYEGAAGAAQNLEKITAKIDSGKGLLGVLLEQEAGDDARSTLKHLASISAAVDDPQAGTLGLLVHDQKLRRRIGRITQEIEGLVTELRDSLEDVREQAPVNAFIGAVFSAF